MDPDNETAPSEEASTPADHALAPLGTTRRPMKSLSGQEWETYRDIIKDLYNRLPLKEVIAYMSEQYNFYATARMYKTRLSQWGLNKYVKNRDMQNLVQKIQSSSDHHVPMELEVDGKAVPRSKVERFAKRKGQSLGKEGPVTSTTPLNSNSPARTDSVGADFIHIDSSGQETEVPSDDIPTPTTTLTIVTSPPPQLDQPSHFERKLPAPLLSGITPGPFAESPEPHLIGIPIPSSFRRSLPLQLEGMKRHPYPQAPGIRTRTLQEPMRTDTMQQALLLALLLSAMIQQRPLGDLADVRMDALERQATLDMNILTPIVDLLGWLQLHRQTVLLAAVYLVRFDASATFPKSHNVWQQLLVALKYAQIYLDDEPYSEHTWVRALPHFANASIGQGILELDVLGDEHIRLHVEKSKWILLESKLSHISASLFVKILERGIFTFETTQQRSGGPMELTSSGFL